MKDLQENSGTDMAEEEAPQEKKTSFKRELLGWIEAIVGAVIIVALIITFVGRPILVSGMSMENTLMDQERIIITPLYGSLKRGDIVVVRRGSDTPLVKRVIALGGDTIDFNWDKREVLVNGEVQHEPYIREETALPVYPILDFPATVPEGYVFVMGDNRNNSLDSRSVEVGMIDTKNVMGKAVFCIWPLNKMGLIRNPNNDTQ